MTAKLLANSDQVCDSGDFRSSLMESVSELFSWDDMMQTVFPRLAFVVVLMLSLNRVSSKECRAGEFRVRPYVQNPAADAMTIRWFTQSSEPGTVTVTHEQFRFNAQSRPVQCPELAHNPFAEEPGGPHPAIPWRHSVRVSGLQPGTNYHYVVRQGTESAESDFRTAPNQDSAVRLIVYSDSETEPESSSAPPVAWPAGTHSHRPDGVTAYLVNQTEGYQRNCQLIEERKPDLLLISGDLVESGGEQRDWDEFWKHNAGEYGRLAKSVPILPALGNHENFAGPGGGYTAEGANFSTAKYLTYFEVPDNKASSPAHRGRYYRIDYGPVTILTLDSSDGLPHQTVVDTNHNLTGSHAPDFNPGSEQYRWLEAELADARAKSRFLFVQFHHTMFGSGPHSIPFGQKDFSGQSGIAMRALLPVLMKHGVDLVFSGHDEMLERSELVYPELSSDHSIRMSRMQFYDVGIGGDGLRGPSVGFDNPFRRFLAHEDAREHWDHQRLVSGGKHYGHLEINVTPADAGRWTVTVEPVYIFPVTEENGQISRWERRVYEDTVQWTE